jgi:hypothetical protein
MSLSLKLHKKSLAKKAKRGFRGYPVATVALYGPDDKRATKVAVGIVPEENGKVTELERWYSAEDDVRTEPSILRAVLEFIEAHGVRSVVMTDRAFVAQVKGVAVVSCGLRVVEDGLIAEGHAEDLAQD